MRETVALLQDKSARAERALAVLREIAMRPTVERNPDGVDQAAWSSQFLAQEAWEGLTGLKLDPPLAAGRESDADRLVAATARAEAAEAERDDLVAQRNLAFYKKEAACARAEKAEAELGRLERDRAEQLDRVTDLRSRVHDVEARAEKAEAERDEWKAQANAESDLRFLADQHHADVCDRLAVAERLLREVFGLTHGMAFRAGALPRDLVDRIAAFLDGGDE